MKKVILSCLPLVLLCGLSFAQQQIDVKSIIMTNDTLQSGFKMTVANSLGQDVIYNSTNSNVINLSGLGICCYLPSVRSSELFNYISTSRDIIYAQMTIANNSAVKLYLSAPTISDDIVLPPKIRKRQSIEVNGKTKFFISKIEVLDAAGNVSAVDNDVILNGDFKALFRKDLAWNLYLFKNVIYTFDEPRN
jgi:hypothetical protein